MENWYTAKCLYDAWIDGEKAASDPSAEYRYLLLCAANESSARPKGEALAKAHEHSYKNGDGQLVSWQLNSVLHVKEIFDFSLREGAEVYYEYRDAADGVGKI